MHLYSACNFLECQASLNYIARFNGVTEGAPNYVDLTEEHREHLQNNEEGSAEEAGSSSFFMDYIAWFIS